ncbi:MAG: sulfotransferase [Candidatus Aureabacteria bacterium]|nr:sulfotransferase [Candidatus Auribacterota bacterium]
MKIFKKIKNTDKYRGRLLKEVVLRGIVAAYRLSAIKTAVRLFCAKKYPEKWIFIVGCYNSGTTLLQRILGRHPDISILPREGVVLTSHLPRPEDYGWTRMWIKCRDRIAFIPEKDEERAERIIADWSPFYDGKKKIFLEKSITNLLRMEWIDMNFKNVYFIGIIRNPYAVAEGIRRKAVPSGPARKEISGIYPIDLPAMQWREANNILRDSAEKVKNFHFCRYEDLVKDPVGILKKIFRFLQVSCPSMDFKNGLLTFEEKKEYLQNMNPKSIERLSSKDINTINDVIGSDIKGFLYEIL